MMTDEQPCLEHPDEPDNDCYTCYPAEEEVGIFINLGRDQLYAQLSDEDGDLRALDWYAHKGKGNYFYAAHRFSVGGGIREREWMHTIVLERVIGRKLREGELADHSNLDKLDNRRSNLRLASRSENEANKRKRKGGGTSKHKGVSFMASRKRWRATIQVDHKQTYLGSFENEDDAGRAYNKAATEIFGEFALLNTFEEETV